jgi:mono/diheme cytochrome c family protein
MAIRLLAGWAAALFLVSAISLRAAQSEPAAGATPAASPASIANGEALFKRNCLMCHGATGLGDGPAAKSLKGKLPNFSDSAAMSKLTDAQIHEAITNGKKTPVGNMPAQGKRLKPEQITDIVSYVRTLAKQL